MIWKFFVELAELEDDADTLDEAEKELVSIQKSLSNMEIVTVLEW